MKTIIVHLYGLYLNVLALILPRVAGQKGFLLFCHPFRMPITEKQKQFFNTADKFTLSVEGHTVQGYRWGRGEKKILMLHGWKSHTYRWKAYIEALSKEDYTLYAMDAPGHGLSSGAFLSVPLYSTLIEAFIKEKAPFYTVVAHSVGGFSLLYTLYRLPLLPVHKIILLGVPGEATDFLDVFQQTLKLSARTMRLVTEHFASRYSVEPEYFSTARFASSVNVKGLIIHDEADDDAPYHYATALHKAWQRSKLITTKGLGHNFRSAEAVKHVVDYVEEPVGQPGTAIRSAR